MITINAANQLRNRKLFEILVTFFMCALFFFLIPNAVYALDKPQALKNLQSLINNPEKAREFRRRIKTASKDELKEYDGVREIMQKEINTISPSLPTTVDRYTTMNSAVMSGNNIVFKYTLSRKMPGIKHKSKFMSEMTTMLNKSICT